VTGTALARKRQPSERNEALESCCPSVSTGIGESGDRRLARLHEADAGYGKPPVQLVAPRNHIRSVYEQKALVERVIAPGVVSLPVRRGQRLGRVEVYDGKRLVATSKLVAAAAASEPGLLGKAAWYAKRTAQNAWGLIT
jgi:hypothetical protein